MRDNAPEAPGVFDPSRGCTSEREREKVELVLQLKAMGRRFEWRGALKVFRRAKASGMELDNNVYRSAIAGMDRLHVSTCGERQRVPGSLHGRGFNSRFHDNPAYAS